MLLISLIAGFMILSVLYKLAEQNDSCLWMIITGVLFMIIGFFMIAVGGSV